MPCVDEIGEVVPVGDVRFEWNVGDFFSLSDKVDNSYASPVFSFAGARWFISIYPNGQTGNSSSDGINLFLHLNYSDVPQTVYFTFGIKGSDAVEEKSELRWEFSKEDEEGYGLFNAWSRSDLENRKDILLPNDTMTVTCHLRANSLCSVKSEKKVLKSLQDLLESGKDSDIVIKVQGKEFKAHRVILQARSPVFRGMLDHDMAENRNNEVTIEDCDPEAFQDFLVHLYSGSCQHISKKNVFALYAIADKYDFEELKAACMDYMERNLSVDGFCEVLTLALTHDEQNLVDSATKFFCRNSLEIVKTADWQVFLKENTTAGNELIIKALSKCKCQ